MKLVITMVLTGDHPTSDKNTIATRTMINAEALERHGQFLVAQEAQKMYYKIMKKYEEVRYEVLSSAQG